MWIDSHCHLLDEAFDKDRGEALERARSSGMLGCLIPAVDEETSTAMAPFLAAEVGFLGAAGVHPHEASKATSETISVVREVAMMPKVAAIGEIGLDYHYDHSPRRVQIKVFEELLDLAADLERPVVIHAREAFKDLFAVMRNQGDEFRGVLHAFTGGKSAMERALSLGLHIGISGIITFPGAHELRATIGDLPIEMALIETDGPYLAPVPHRGKRNEPSFITETASAAAECLGVGKEELLDRTRMNAETLFGPFSP